MESPQLPRSAASYTTRLDRTLKILQERVRDQETALEELRAVNSPISSRPRADRESRLQQIRSLNATYEALNAQEPYLPFNDSTISALLALRSVQRCIDETEHRIASTKLDLKTTKDRLEWQLSELEDIILIQRRLETRTQSLQSKLEKRSQGTPEQIAKELIREMKRKKNHYDVETGNLVKAFNWFIDNHLAPFLAAEELGGPIVGEALNLDEEMLEGEFNVQGKLKRSKCDMPQDSRQRRIDEVWGSRTPGKGKSKEQWDEKRAAAAEMRDLTEQLLNSLVEAEGGAAYVDLERESAAARFLVRSKVAQFHPRNARRLRLLDFGRDIEA